MFRRHKGVSISESGFSKSPYLRLHFDYGVVTDLVLPCQSWGMLAGHLQRKYAGARNGRCGCRHH
jgi:hypothetical protein